MNQPPTDASTEAPAAADAAPRKKKLSLLRRLYRWVLHWAETPYGTPALAVISFCESSFFPIPPDVLQIALSVSRPTRSFFYAAINAVASVAGAVLGWVIGYGLWHLLSEFFYAWIPGVTPDNIARVQDLYQQNAYLAIFTAAFSPIPFKVFTITAGMASIPLGTLVIASAVGRSGRFFIVATAIYFFGPKVKEWLEKYLEITTLVFTVLLVGGVVAIKYLLH